MVKRRSLLFFLSCFLILFILPQPLFAKGPSIQAKAAALIDVQSGRVLYEKNGNERLPIASLTKIMTAIVAIEEGNLEDKVKVGKNAVGVEGSSIYLRQNEEMRLEDLLYGLMLRSGNDAAVAIAEHIGGSVDGFVYLMNEKAEFLGLTNTHFMNPHGLDHPDHYSTAHDLALLTAYALKNPIFKKIVATKIKNVPMPGEEWDRKWINKNKMLRLYPGADGIKTGYTKIANRCLASSATREGRQLATIVLHDGNDWNDSMRLLDFGFQEYQNVEVIPEHYTLDEVLRGKNFTLETMRSSVYPLQEGELGKVTSKVVWNEENLKKGFAPSGYLHLFLGKELIDQVPLRIAQKNDDLKTKKEKQPSFLDKWGIVLQSLIREVS
ncbi:Serine-type D-Ala-D-Ala carboxypeptidase [[Clostridium] ultunense Esp]|nr:Serine-type D-Ala-D-Ala carboxypeptidase [[Clostridium] ultunense Esp]